MAGRQPKFKKGELVYYVLIPSRPMIVTLNKFRLYLTDSNFSSAYEFTGKVKCSWADDNGNRQEQEFSEEELKSGIDMNFSALETDVVSLIKKSTGQIFENLKASVQTNKIFMTRSDIRIDPGDLIQRKMSNGAEETYLIEDPGFHEKFHGIPAGYQMKVRKLGIPEAEREKNSITYNIHFSGNNNRFNNNSVDQSVNNVQIKNQIDEHISDLRNEIQKLNISSVDKNDLLELTEALQEQFDSGKPKNAVVKNILSSLSEHGANISSIGSLILQMLPMFGILPPQNL